MPRLSRPMPSAQGLVWSRFWTNAAISATSPLASVLNPNSLGSWPTKITTARPARYPVRTGFESRSATKPSLARPAPVVISPTRIASIPARAIASSWLPAARGRIVAAIMGPSEESGPSTRTGEGPTSVYATRHTTVVYSPVIAGSPESSAYAIPCGTRSVTRTIPATRSRDNQDRSYVRSTRRPGTQRSTCWRRELDVSA